MPRLSLYRPEKGNNFRYIDRIIEQQFQIGGTDLFVHKYVGPVAPVDGEASPAAPVQTNPISELGIQDLILMENRDRHYDPNVYTMRGIYTMQDLDFNLSQFGIFLNNDNIFMHLHLRNCVETLGRKIMPGDVLELPHLQDEYALNDALVALKRFYVVQDVTRASNGFSQTWYPHILRVKCVPMTDTQEYNEILDSDAGAGDGTTIRDLMSSYNTNIDINNAIVAQAEEDAPLSGYDIAQYYVVPIDSETGFVKHQDASNENIDASLDSIDGVTAVDASDQYQTPEYTYYVGYLTEDGVPPNGARYTHGITFPTTDLVEGQFHLRTDYFPNRLFRYNGKHWMLVEKNVRMTLSNNYDPDTKSPDSDTVPYPVTLRATQKTGFINNNNSAVIGGKVVPERQALSKALKPKADN